MPTTDSITLNTISSKPFVGDVGFKIILDGDTSLTGYDALNISYTNPSNVTGSWSATADSSDNTKAYHTSKSGELAAGIYKLNLKVTKTSGEILTLNTNVLKVYNNGEV